ncbi:mucin-5AC-like [Pecten maximus]|uniref:mucin-5AC-like n=1 Tax=Pecten maximus TaxID=6579 RepID=UPI001458279F|nr:mucin-5AC-like [Pecten maximus]
MMLFREFIVTGVFAVLSVSCTLCCEHQIFVENGGTASIYSPGYEQGSYQLDVHCTWNISTTTHGKLKLTFLDFNIEYHMLCIWDYVLVYNGTCGSGGDIKRYCGTDIESNIVSSTAEACVEFHSDQYVVKPGFRLLVTSQQEQLPTTVSSEKSSSDTTPMIFTSSTTSPTSSLTTSSTLPQTSSTTISSTPSSGDTTIPPLPSTISPFTPMFPYPSQLNVQTLLIGQLSSTFEDPTVIEMCKDISWYQAENQALVISPGYAQNQNYGNNRNCHLKILNPGKKVVQFSFIIFNVEKHPTCAWDKLEITEAQDSILATICGFSADTPENLKSSAADINLVFISDNVVNWSGFQVKLSLHDTAPTPEPPSTLLTTEATTPNPNYVTTPVQNHHPIILDKGYQQSYVNDTVTVLSPNFGPGKTYPVSVTCGLKIQALNNQKIRVNVLDFKVEYHPSCSWDRLSIYDGPSKSSSLLGTFCGVKSDVAIDSSGAVLFLEFVSDYIVPDKGFQLDVSTKIDATTTIATTPLPMTSTFAITTPPTTPSNVETTTSYTDTPETIPSTTPSTVPATSLTASPSTMSSVIPLTTIKTLTTLLTTPSATVPTSPSTATKATSINTPTTIPPNTAKTSTSTSKTISVTLTSSPTTKPTIPSTTKPSTTLPTSTSKTTPWYVSTTTPNTRLTTLTTSTTESSDTVIELCVGKTAISLPAKGVYVTSPNYISGNYPTNIKCGLTVNTSSTQVISVEMIDMDIEENAICSWDSLSVYDGPTRSSNRLAKLCGKTLPHQSLLSSSNVLHFHFESDFVIPRKGFKAKVTSVQDLLTVSTTPISKPTLVPGNTVKISTESLTTTPQEASSKTQATTEETTKFTEGTTEPTTINLVTILKTSMKVPTTPTTTLSTTAMMTTAASKPATSITSPAALHITSMTSTTTLKTTTKSTTMMTTMPKTKTKISSITKPPSSTMTTQSATMTSPQTSFTTTVANVTNLPLECRGVPQVHTLPSGTIQSPGIDLPYPHNTTCEWVVIAASNHVIELNFFEFDLEPDCDASRVTIYDSSTSIGPILATFCGGDIPGNVTSTSKVLFVSLMSNNTTKDNGFKANYTAIAKVVPVQPCLAGEFACPGGECIPDEWLCDGEVDCIGAGDELSCQLCLDGEFRCGNGECIPGLLRCDGHDDCVEGLDEYNCLSIGDAGQYVMVMYHAQWYPVCSDDWSTQTSDVICQQLAFSDSTSMTPVNTDSMVFMTLKDDSPVTSQSIHTMFEPTLNCNSRQQVQLQCKHNGCGMRSPNLMQPYIIGGTKSYTGQWPWMVALKINQKFICGGTLISQQWVATASHCIESVSARPYLLNVMLGSIAMNPADAVYYKVTEVIIHPDNFFIYQADLALLRLQKPVIFNDHVNSLCLATEGHALTKSSICYVSGWGVLSVSDFYSTIMPEYLHHAKMKLVTHSKCKESYQGKLKDTMLCAGYDLGRIDSCKGDSGGPLMCKVSADRWVLAGITSWGETPCGQAMKPGVYTRVDKYRDWILGIMDDDGKQYNCTYETPGLCGHIDVSLSEFMWTRRSHDPTFDHTWGNATGHFMYAENPNGLGASSHEAILKIPAFLKDDVKCMSLAVFFSGSQSDMKLKIMGHVTPNVIRQLSEISSFSSSWSVAYITIDDDVTEVDIVAVRGVRGNVGVAIDDVMVAGGHCQDNIKLGCTFDGGNTCLYTNDKDDIYDWSLQSAEIGYFIEFSGADKYPGDKARFSSPIMTRSIPRCVKFLYQVCPQSSGTLTLLTQVYFGGVPLLRAPVWTSQLSNCTDWSLAQVDVDHQSHPFGVAFEASRGQHSGSIRVDDISITQGNCF